MPPIADIQRYLTGAWRMMTGRGDGLNLLDISADGFWTSFFAIVVALPALLAGWVGLADDIAAASGTSDRTLIVVVKLAVIDLSVWILPLIALLLFGRFIGIADRVVHCVIALNWGSALIAWIILPGVILLALEPGSPDFNLLVSLALFGLTLYLMWRLLDSAIGKGRAIAGAVLAGLVFVSLLVQFGAQDLLGLAADPQISG